jgi:thiol:disulfide interchange protein
MKRLSAIFVLLAFLPLVTFSQILTPVKWTFKVEQSKADEATLYMIATIDHGWHVYSRNNPQPPNGPIGTTFKFTPSKDYQLVGDVTEPKPIEEKDSQFDNQTLRYFEHSATFKQKIKVLGKADFKVSGSLEFMCCNDSQCIPPDDVDYTFNIKGNPAGSEIVVAKTVVTKPDITVKNADTSKPVTTVAVTKQAKLKRIVLDKQTKNSLLAFFIISLLAGLLAILTPCVFPMIPMTVTFFMHDSGNKRKARFQAIVYGLSIIFIYTVIGTIVAITLGANFANFLSTHWIPNVFFFLIFMIFAASFLGMFEITLPNWLVNKADKQADKGGFTGAFFMAFTLVLVSFSCTGPIVGAILVQSAGGQILQPIIGMLGFSIAFALPFGLFAFFPSWLAGLPKSGGWLNSVKVVLGFLELALGLKFLSIADQTYHWHILDREVYLAFWIVIFFLMGLYLLGKLKFHHDSEVNTVSVPRLSLAIITFTFVVYMIPGMWGAPLKALAGYLPPQESLDFDLTAIIRNEVKDEFGRRRNDQYLPL